MSDVTRWRQTMVSRWSSFTSVADAAGVPVFLPASIVVEDDAVTVRGFSPLGDYLEVHLSPDSDGGTIAYTSPFNTTSGRDLICALSDSGYHTSAFRPYVWYKATEDLSWFEAVMNRWPTGLAFTDWRGSTHVVRSVRFSKNDGVPTAAVSTYVAVDGHRWLSDDGARHQGAIHLTSPNVEYDARELRDRGFSRTAFVRSAYPAAPKDLLASWPYGPMRWPGSRDGMIFGYSRKRKEKYQWCLNVGCVDGSTFVITVYPLRESGTFTDYRVAKAELSQTAARVFQTLAERRSDMT